MRLLFLIFMLFVNKASIGQLTVEEVAALPESVSNNAVCERFIGR